MIYLNIKLVLIKLTLKLKIMVLVPFFFSYKFNVKVLWFYDIGASECAAQRNLIIKPTTKKMWANADQSVTVILYVYIYGKMCFSFSFHFIFILSFEKAYSNKNEKPERRLWFREYFCGKSVFCCLFAIFFLVQNFLFRSLVFS